MNEDRTFLSNGWNFPPALDRDGTPTRMAAYEEKIRQSLWTLLSTSPGVMHTRMAMGKSVHIKGLGYFRYTLDTVGVENLDDFDFEKQVKAVRVEFTPPERERLSGSKAYTRALVDSDELESIELSPETKDDDPAQGGGTQEDNPLG